MRKSFFLLVALILVSQISIAGAQDTSVDKRITSWYGEQTDFNGDPCCKKSCTTVERYRQTSDSVWMFFGGVWREVDNYWVSRSNTPDGKAHWCGAVDNTGYLTYCAFIPNNISLLLKK